MLGLTHTLDIGGYAAEDENVEEAVDVLRQYIVHVHCKDRGIEPDKPQGRFRKGMGVVPVGSGYLPMARIIRRLHDSGYDGYLAIEHFYAADQLSFIRRSAAFLTSVIDQCAG